MHDNMIVGVIAKIAREKRAYHLLFIFIPDTGDGYIITAGRINKFQFPWNNTKGGGKDNLMDH